MILNLSSFLHLIIKFGWVNCRTDKADLPATFRTDMSYGIPIVTPANTGWITSDPDGSLAQFPAFILPDDIRPLWTSSVIGTTPGFFYELKPDAASGLLVSPNLMLSTPAIIWKAGDPVATFVPSGRIVSFSPGYPNFLWTWEPVHSLTTVANFTDLATQNLTGNFIVTSGGIDYTPTPAGATTGPSLIYYPGFAAPSHLINSGVAAAPVAFNIVDVALTQGGKDYLSALIGSPVVYAPSALYNDIVYSGVMNAVTLSYRDTNGWIIRPNSPQFSRAIVVDVSDGNFSATVGNRQGLTAPVMDTLALDIPSINGPNARTGSAAFRALGYLPYSLGPNSVLDSEGIRYANITNAANNASFSAASGNLI